MFDKRAIELSLNFIVILIISIIIFGFGIRFIYNLSSKAKDITDLTYDQLDQRIGDIICEGSERVCVGIDRKTIQKKDFGVFGMRIINILESSTATRNFRITVSPPTAQLGFKKDNTPITVTSSFSGLIVIPPISNPRDIVIEKNEEKTVGIGIEVPPNAVSGTYILDVRIDTDGVTPHYSEQKLYVEVP
ncbi:hypothetical protein HYX00_00965 [Candidatus Woesearchaeota archaeon]|nr:hypothetical protein [Candidatus Woesearchaeota archaeon]